MNADDTKRCSKCWRYLPLSDFDEDGRTRDRLTYRCRDCRTEHGAYGDKPADTPAKPFPLRYAPIDQRLDALADLLTTLPIEFDGVRLDGSIVQDLHDAASLLRAHRECPRPEPTSTTTRPTSRRAAIRRHYG